jgi:TPR repeat protein
MTGLIIFDRGMYHYKKHNIFETIKYYRLSVERENKDSQYALGELYEKKGEIEKAIACFESELLHNDKRCVNKIGELYEKINRKKAIRYYEKTEQSIEICKRLAILYRKDGYYSKAIEIYKKLADQSDAEAIYLLAKMYRYSPNHSEAIPLFQKSVDLGYLYAKYTIFKMKKMGYDHPLALEYIEDASDHDNPHAMKILADSYMTGGPLLVKKDIIKAISLYQRCTKIDFTLFNYLESCNNPKKLSGKMLFQIYMETKDLNKALYYSARGKYDSGIIEILVNNHDLLKEIYIGVHNYKKYDLGDAWVYTTDYKKINDCIENNKIPNSETTPLEDMLYPSHLDDSSKVVLMYFKYLDDVVDIIRSELDKTSLYIRDLVCIIEGYIKIE